MKKYQICASGNFCEVSGSMLAPPLWNQGQASSGRGGEGSIRSGVWLLRDEGWGLVCWGCCFWVLHVMTAPQGSGKSPWGAPCSAVSRVALTCKEFAVRSRKSRANSPQTTSNAPPVPLPSTPPSAAPSHPSAGPSALPTKG